MTDVGATLLERCRIHVRAGIGQQRFQASVADLDVGTAVFRKDGLAWSELDRSNSGGSADGE